MTRLRQVAFVARDLEPAAAALRDHLDLDEPYRDPGVGEFGLHNVVFAAGDTFIEIVSPKQDATTAGRYLDRRGGDSGYMAIFQVDDTAATRRRATELGARIVWQADLPDISGTHLHPRDMPGAIVSFDTPLPPESWRWAGPAWTGTAPAHAVGGITGITVEVDDPAAAAERWAAVLDLAVTADNALTLEGGAQRIAFVPAEGREPSIIELRVATETARGNATVCGVGVVGSALE
jgi:catechol 2,3-dioxygenase-like lactoylglutathione lyase family enzyme